MRRVSQILIFLAFAAVGAGFPPTLGSIVAAESGSSTVDAGIAPTDAGAVAGSGSSSGSGLTVVVTVPPGQLANPAANPIEAYDEIKTAQRAGWPALLFTILALALKGAAYGYVRLQNVPVLGAAAAWLAVGKRAMAVAGAATVATAIALALTSGTTWTAALMAGALALAGVTKSTVTPAVTA